MNKSELFTELYKRYGAVTRARGPFFYTKKGVRVTDLYQEAGRAILGWEGGSAFTMFKNVLSRGQTGSFICEDCPEPRLQKAVSELLASDRTIFCFSSHKDAFDAGLSLFPDETSVYRPWNSINEKINISKTAALIVTPPLPWAESIFILAVDTKRIQENPVKSTIALSIPIIVLLFLDTFYAVADLYWIGSIGTSAIVCMGYISNAVYVLSKMGDGIGRAVNVLISNAFGARRRGKTKIYAQHGMILIFAVSIILFLSVMTSNSYIVQYVVIQCGCTPIPRQPV